NAAHDDGLPVLQAVHDEPRASHRSGRISFDSPVLGLACAVLYVEVNADARVRPVETLEVSLKNDDFGILGVDGCNGEKYCRRSENTDGVGFHGRPRALPVIEARIAQLFGPKI